MHAKMSSMSHAREGDSAAQADAKIKEAKPLKSKSKEVKGTKADRKEKEKED